MSRRRVVISGVGAVTPAGIGLTPLRDALVAGAPLARPIQSFDAGTFPMSIAGQVPQLDPKAWVKRRKDVKLLSRDSLLAVGAARDLLDAHVAALPEDRFAAGLFLGVGLEEGDPDELTRTLVPSTKDGAVQMDALAAEGMGQMNPLASLKTLPNMALGHIAIQCGLRGPNYALSPFDSAGLQAVGEATRAIQRGEIDVAVAGATDAKVSVFGLTTFARLGYLAQTGTGEVPPPFDVRRSGACPAEGAAVFLLEEEHRARNRGASILAEVGGIGEASDGARVGPPESPDGFIAAMRAALEDAKIEPRRVAAVHPAGGGSRAGDHSESVAILNVLGSRAWVFTTKHVLGDAFAAGGVLGVAGAVCALGAGAVHGIRGYGLDITCPLRMAPPDGGALDDEWILVNAGALGGSYTSLALRRPESS